MKVAGSTFLITGGSSGLGKATARYLVERDANVVIADIDAEAGEGLASALKENALFCQADITCSSSLEAVLRDLENHYGNIHGLVNCAGILVAERVLKKDGKLFELDQFRQCLEVNLVGTFNAIRMVSRAMSINPVNADEERGVIINTASIAAYEGQIGQVAYAASKAGIIGMTLPLARELGRFGIRVMAIAPGVFDTPLFSSTTEKVRQALEQQIPFPKRLGNPAEFSALVHHIIENPMLNGEVIRLDGALRMGEG